MAEPDLWFTAVISSMSALEPGHSDLGREPVDSEEATSLSGPTLLFFCAPCLLAHGHLIREDGPREPPPPPTGCIKDACKTTYILESFKDAFTPVGT